MLGMSGGVDSSVAAALLLRQGYEVIGITMQIWPDKDRPANAKDGGCCSLAAVDDARRVADILGIPYYVLNFKEIFERTVIDNFVAEYMEGRTPNPCIECNRHLKFEAMLEKALSMEIDFIATGHYARRVYDDASGRYLLKKSVTEEKDQTYALYTITQQQLAHTLFPIGEYRKEDIRRMAQELKLPVFDKPDSQEICFIPDDDYGRYIRENTGMKIREGDFIDRAGNRIGSHKGIPFYTIGQRKGLGKAFGKPMFVAAINASTNEITLDSEDGILTDSLRIGELSLVHLLPEELPESFRMDVKIRYSAKATPATVRLLQDGSAQIVFDKPQRAITPGQSAVLYDGDILIGGGVIV
jgi:tRNA-specific 2-thiouridylase